MARLETLESILTSDKAARERGAMPVEDWAAQLREFRNLRKQRESKMTVATKARKNMTKLKTRRQEIESEYASLNEKLKLVRAGSAERILNGAALDKETQLVTDQRLQCDTLANALELSKERERTAADVLYQLEMEEARLVARKLRQTTFSKLDKLSAAIGKLTAAQADLKDTAIKLGHMGGRFAKTEGAGMFSSEARVIGQASRVLQNIKKEWAYVEKMRARYESTYTDAHKNG